VFSAGRTLPFDEKARLVWARLRAEGAAAGRVRSALDMIIPAVAASTDCIVITHNRKNFQGIGTLDQLRAGA
jgi:predicted nucleic acid-binding protein